MTKTYLEDAIKVVMKGDEKLVHEFVDNASKDDWATGSTCKINLSDGSVVETYTASSGAQCYLTGGNHVGEIATIKEVEIKRSSMPNEVTFEEGFGTIQEYVMVIPSSDDIPMEVNE